MEENKDGGWVSEAASFKTSPFLNRCCLKRRLMEGSKGCWGVVLAGEVIIGGAKISLISIELLLLPLPLGDPTSFIHWHSAVGGQRFLTDKLLLTCPGEVAPTNSDHPLFYDWTQLKGFNATAKTRTQVVHFKLSRCKFPKGKFSPNSQSEWSTGCRLKCKEEIEKASNAISSDDFNILSSYTVYFALSCIILSLLVMSSRVSLERQHKLARYLPR